MPIYKCPKCGGTTLTKLVHATEVWLIDEFGECCEQLSAETEYEEDTLMCNDCGYEADYSEFEVEEDDA